MWLNVKAVRLAMIDKGLSISDLSRRSKLGTATINGWLNHGRKPQMSKISQLAKALGVSVLDIVEV